MKNYTDLSQKHKENCEYSKIESTNSQLENMFLKIMPWLSSCRVLKKF